MKSSIGSKGWTRSAAFLAGFMLCLPGALPAQEILPVAGVTPGMKGYGLTVVSGESIERFDVEVVGVIPNSSFGRATIVVRVSGLGLEQSGIVAGMSGSPVYLDGKLAGAIASGWAFSKSPIGGVTPIESMLTIEPEGAPSLPPTPGPIPARESPSGKKATAGTRPAALTHSLGALPGVFSLSEEDRLRELQKLFADMQPSPVAAGGSSLLAPSLAGFPAETLGRFQESLTRLGLPVTASTALGAASAPAASSRVAPAGPLTGGSAISALLVDGDLQLGVTGTVTRVGKDGRFVAFGHPFLGWGDLDLPVAPARVLTVLPNVFQSFKLGYPLAPAYRLTKDRDTGVAGRTDRVAPMVPVKFRFESETGDVRTLSWSVAPHPKLLPILLALSCDAALTTSDPSPRERTLHMRLAFDTAGGTIAYEDEVSGFRAKELALMSAATLAGAIADNDLEEPKLSGVELSFRSGSGERRLRLADAALASRKVAPGETLVATVRLADRRGAETTRVVKIKVPREAPEGRAVLVVADGTAASAMRFGLEPAEPRTLDELRKMIARLVPSDRLVAALVVPARGAATGSATLTALPPTAAVLLAEGANGAEGASQTVSARLLAEEILTLDRPLHGSIRLELEIERPRS
jgi:hypothetical protein